jgi:hypothetical protein
MTISGYKPWLDKVSELSGEQCFGIKMEGVRRSGHLVGRIICCTYKAAQIMPDSNMAVTHHHTNPQ